ncbi:translocation/assembly module TamB domain-containing protein [Tropicimonas sp. IMCC34043]|uniref:translocation/assembly module TamB domain-containing protein n=1 Tax=Tropicimonas sp. IMCC34043 TaxID=2248760 RepID=UPI000E22DE2C|nr:translocation/assembly module TamB domain-containing protein [Tropicimonas sp. IMCC34043]
MIPARTLSRPLARTALVLVIVLPIASAQAQNDDGSFLQRFLQSRLSSAGREVRISGFQGLLAGKAQLAEMTIADDEGVWLTLRNATLDWNRAALLRGRLTVNELTAGELIVVRRPVPAPTDTTEVKPPKAEASGFSLPELPVAVRIDKLGIARVELGEAVIGQAAALTLDGTLALAGGDGNVDIRAARVDGRDDHLTLQGSFSNDTRVLAMNVALQEAPGGLASIALKLPGAPSIDLSLTGQGPLDNFAADLGLATDGQDRVTGQVALIGDGSGGTDFTADLGGDVTPLIPADLHEFFGTDVQFATRGNLGGDGALVLQEVSMRSQSLDLHGSAQIDADGLPTAFNLQGNISDRDGGGVLLPISGTPTTIDQAQIEADFNAAEDDRWDMSMLVDGVDREGTRIDLASLTGFGTIRPSDPRSVTAEISYLIDGITLAEPALAQAVGTSIKGALTGEWADGKPLTLSAFRLDGADYGLTASGDLGFANRSVQIAGQTAVRADELSRFSGLAGRPLTGAVTANLSGNGDPLGGLFDLTLDLQGQGLSIGQEAVDNLLTEPVTLSMAARRDTEGTELDRFELRSRAVTADASGKVGGGASDMTFKVALSDVGLVLPGREGALALAGTGRESAPGDWQVGLDLEGPYELTGRVDGRVNPGKSDITLDLSLPDIAPLVPGHSGPVKIAGTAAEAGAAGRWQVDLNADGPYDLTAAIDGIASTNGNSDLALKLRLPDVAPLAPGFTGAVDLDATAAQTATGGWEFRADGSGPYQAALALDGNVGDGPSAVHLTAGLPDLAPLVPGFGGPVQAEGTANDNGDGRWNIDFGVTGPQQSRAKVDGVVGGGTSALALDVALADLSVFVPQLPGPLTARGTAAENGDGRWKVDLTADGPFRSSASARGLVGAAGSDLTAALAVPDVSPLAPSLRGAVNANMTAAQTDAGAWQIGVDATGPYRSTLRANGQVGGGPIRVTFDAGLPDVGPLAPSISGPVTMNGSADQTTNGAWAVNFDAGGPYRSTARVNGTFGAAGSSADITVSIPTISPFAPGIAGGLDARGNVSQDTSGIRVNLTSTGPQGASTAIAGTLAPDFSTMAMTARGSAPLGLANGFIDPTAIDGTVQFDLAVNGAPALQSVSGTIGVNGARVTIPTAEMSFTDIGFNARIANSAVQIDASARNPEGGSVSARGSVGLTGAMIADLQANLNNLVLSDPNLFKTSLGGRVTMAGPILGNASISGRIDVGRTEIRVPDGGLGFGGSIPEISHLNEPAAVFQTRKRAGLVVVEDTGNGRNRSGSGTVYNLDVRINVPDQVFIRGRGLDTEMGGSVRITGTTANVLPVGEISVIRGRLDILGRRLTVDQGTISLAGGLQPYIDLSATSKRDDFEFTVRIYGPVDDPQFELSSTPSLPEDEVLARFLFGKGIDDLSPLQAVQLANALAQLTGRGGIDLFGGLREGLGLDDLDLQTTENGDTELRAGMYLSDNVYTEFVADSQGETEIDVNIDISHNLTLRGRAASDGDSAIGLFWERDY